MRSLLLPFAVLLVTLLTTCQASPSGRCASFCPQDYTPLCAERGGIRKTFTNRCEFTTTNCIKQYKWVFKHVGECVAERCLKACTMDYTPVCGVFHGELRTFSNVCSMDVFGCEHKQKWQVYEQGVCNEQQPEQQQHPSPDCRS